MLPIYTSTNDLASFSCLVGAVLSPGQLLPCPKETVADLYQNTCFSVLLSNVTKSLKEAEADPTWVQSTLASRLVCSDYFVVGNMVYVHVGQSTFYNNHMCWCVCGLQQQ